jgi:hypothetical protein
LGRSNRSPSGPGCRADLRCPGSAPAGIAANPTRKWISRSSPKVVSQTPGDAQNNPLMQAVRREMPGWPTRLAQRTSPDDLGRRNRQLDVARPTAVPRVLREDQTTGLDVTRRNLLAVLDLGVGVRPEGDSGLAVGPQRQPAAVKVVGPVRSPHIWRTEALAGFEPEEACLHHCDTLPSCRPAIGGRRAVLDGEIVALNEAGCPSFQRLQPRWPQQRRHSSTAQAVLISCFGLVSRIVRTASPSLSNRRLTVGHTVR